MTTYESASEDLVTAVDRVVETWLVRVATDRLRAHVPTESVELNEAVLAAAHEARVATVRRLRDVLFADVDSQSVNPLQVLRHAADFLTPVLRSADVPHAVRDEFDARINPDDVYGLYPAHWSDVDDSLTEPGIVWGAAKAATVLQRRRAEGKLEP